MMASCLAMAQHQMFFYAAVFLAPSCLLILILVVLQGCRYFQTYTEEVEAEITEIEQKPNGNGGSVYLPYYRFSFGGREYTAPDAGSAGILWMIPPRGGFCRIRINPEEPERAVFVPETYKRKLLVGVPWLFLLTAAAFWGLSS